MRQISIPTVGFEPAIPANERLYTHALDLPATWIDINLLVTTYFIVRLFCYIISVYCWTACIIPRLEESDLRRHSYGRRLERALTMFHIELIQSKPIQRALTGFSLQFVAIRGRGGR